MSLKEQCCNTGILECWNKNKCGDTGITDNAGIHEYVRIRDVGTFITLEKHRGQVFILDRYA